MLWPELIPPASSEQTEPIAPVPVRKAHRGDEKKRSAACFNCGKEGHKKAQCPLTKKSVKGGNHLQQALKDEVDRADGNAIAAKELAAELRELRQEVQQADAVTQDANKLVEDLEKRLKEREEELARRNRDVTDHVRQSVEGLSVTVRRSEWSETIIALMLIAQVALAVWSLTESNIPYPSKCEQVSIGWWTPDVHRFVPCWKVVTVPRWGHNLANMVVAAGIIWWALVLIDKKKMLRVFPSYRVTFLRWADPCDLKDLRADVNSLQALKHKDPLYCWVRYSSLTTSGEALISAELLAQLSAVKYMDPLMDYETAKFKIVNAVASTQMINIDRYRAFAGSNVGLDTAVVALALWRQYKDSFEEMGFGLRPQ